MNTQNKITRLPWRQASSVAATLALVVLVLLGCEPAVGDACETNLDCPGGSTCDPTAPGGYCLVVGCDSGDDCPEESVCVAFDRHTTFCLASCGSNDDCRDGYTCRADVGDEKFCFVKPEGDAPFTRAE